MVFHSVLTAFPVPLVIVPTRHGPGQEHGVVSDVHLLLCRRAVSLMTSVEIAELREFISGELQKVHTRFDGVDGRLDQVDGRFGQVDGRLDQVEGGLAEVRTGVDQVQVEQQAFQAHVAHHFGAVYTRLDDVSTRLSREETKHEEMRSDFRVFGEGLGSTNRRIEDLRSDMDRGFGELRQEISAGFRSWGGRIVALEDRVEGMEAKRG